uniref:Ovule protein n=1 Tax=Gongylonema pulchrum TaxID=637853 RepID=A0A183D4P9_9BILA
LLRLPNSRWLLKINGYHRHQSLNAHPHRYQLLKYKNRTTTTTSARASAFSSELQNF